MTTIDKRAVDELLVDLWYDIDHNEGRSAHEHFTDNATLTFDARTFSGTEEIRGVYRARAERGERTSLHVVTNVHVQPVTDAVPVETEPDGGVNARALQVTSVVTLYAADGPPPLPDVTPICVAEVVDEVVWHGCRFLIADRVWRSLFRAADIPLAVPTR